MNIWRDSYEAGGWRYTLWTEQNIAGWDFPGRNLFDAFQGVYHAQADILRYAVLQQYGGIYIDADTAFVKLLDERFLAPAEGAWVVRERAESSLLCNGFLGAEPGHPLLAAVIHDLAKLDVAAIAAETREELHGAAWVLTGPCCLSEVIKASQIPVAIYPSSYFMPEHHDGSRSDGEVFGHHWWGTTRRKYE